jgi:hypothetical protein
MKNRSVAVCGLVVSFVFSLGFAVDQSPISAASAAAKAPKAPKAPKSTCSKKNLGKVVAGRVCALRKRRYVWVESAVAATSVPSANATTPSLDTPTPTNPAPSAQSGDTQRLKGPGGGWALDVPASWTVNTQIQGTVSATDSQTGAELWLGVFPARAKFAQVIADNPKLMKGEYGVNLVKSESGSHAGSAIQTLWYSEPGSTKEIVVRIYERELSVGGFLIAEITVKNKETEALLLGSLDRMDVQWRPAT